MIWLAFGLGVITGMVAGIFLVGLLQMAAQPAQHEIYSDPFPRRLES